MKILDTLKEKYSNYKEELTIEEYLKACKRDKNYYINAAERLLKAIGEPEIIDTKKDERLGRIFGNKKIRRYPAFSEFYGMEDVIEKIVSFFKHSAQGLEAKKQVLYLMGPVGTAKSSLALKIKQLMEKNPIYTIKAEYSFKDERGITRKINEISPVYESPLGLFHNMRDELFKEYGIPQRYVPVCMSPWLVKRMKETNGDYTKFKVVKLYPSIQEQISISKIEPGDDNNQDVTTLIGNSNISKLGEYSENDPDAYSYGGGLCLGNQGIAEFVEMFKAPIKMLNPLLTATQERCYNPSVPIGSIPFDGVIVSHSNESEWEKFQSDKKNEAFLDRIYLIKVPYCLRISEEMKIYEKNLRDSELSDRAIAPKVLSTLAEFAVMTRLMEPQNSKLYSKMKVYDGESLKRIDTNAKSLQEYKEIAGVREGMTGISTRFMFKALAETFNYDPDEIAANPVHLFIVLTEMIRQQEFDKDTEEKYLNTILDELKTRYAEYLGEEINRAYIDSYSSYGQNMFNNYFMYAKHWLEDKDFRDPETGLVYDRETLDDELEKVEIPAGVVNKADFRNESVRYILTRQLENKGTMPKWDCYEPLKDVIEKELYKKVGDLLPIISFTTTKTSEEDEKKHKNFVKRMTDRGYTNKQVKILVEWYLQVKNNS